MIQSILFDKSKYSLQKAMLWIKKHHYTVNTETSNFRTTNYWRFRQIEPKKNVSYYTKKIDNGIYFVLMYNNKNKK